MRVLEGVAFRARESLIDHMLRELFLIQDWDQQSPSTQLCLTSPQCEDVRV